MESMYLLVQKEPFILRIENQHEIQMNWYHSLENKTFHVMYYRFGKVEFVQVLKEAIFSPSSLASCSVILKCQAPTIVQETFREKECAHGDVHHLCK